MVNQNIKAVIDSVAGTTYEYGAGGECEGWILHNLDTAETLTFNVGGQDVKVGPKTWKRVDCVDDSVTVTGVGEFNIIALENGDAEIERMASGSGGGGGGTTITGEILPGEGSAASRTGFSTHIVISDQAATFTGPRYFSLPQGPEAWVTYRIKDGQGNASTYPINVAAGAISDTIDGSASPVTITADYGSLSFIFDGVSNWIIV